MVNPNHITPYGGDPGERARARRRPRLQPPRGRARAVHRRTSSRRATRTRPRPSDPTEGMEPEEALHWHILRRKKEGVEDWIDRSVEKIGAVPTLNEVLLPAMKEVGDKFGAGELILPFVLQSAEVMKRAVAQLENYLERIEGHTKGKVVIATVFGDVHDIGKSLVNTILTNNGYTVVDLGKQVPIDTIIDAAVEHEADAIGLSALLVSTSKQMPACIQELHERGLEFPVLIGGAAINRDFGRRALYPQRQGVRRGLRARRLLLQGRLRRARHDGRADRRRRRARRWSRRSATRRDELREKPGRSSTTRRRPPTTRVRSAARTDNADPRAAVLGRARGRGRPRRGLPLPRPPRAVQAPLGRARQEGRGVAPDRRGPRRRGGLRAEARADVARAGLPAARGRGSATSPATPTATSSSIFDPDDHDREIERLVFPRQPKHDRICLADFYRPLNDVSGERDVVALQGVTVGAEVTERIDAARAGRRVRRAALRPRARRPGRRGPGRVAARRGPRASSASTPTRAAATPGATPPARTSPSTRRSGACSASRRSG